MNFHTHFVLAQSLTTQYFARYFQHYNVRRVPEESQCWSATAPVPVWPQVRRCLLYYSDASTNVALNNLFWKCLERIVSGVAPPNSGFIPSVKRASVHPCTCGNVYHCYLLTADGNHMAWPERLGYGAKATVLLVQQHRLQLLVAFMSCEKWCGFTLPRGATAHKTVLFR